jgi:exopolysaccharide production protein ExoZ
MRGRNSTTTNRPLQIPRMTRPATFFSIQALRGIAALMVVLFHLRIVEGKYGQDGNLLGAMFAYADSGVDLFFMLSGFVMTSIAAGSYGSPRNAGDFLARRGWRVLPLYWFYTTLVVALMLLMPGMANSAYQDQSILASYLLWPQAQLPLLTVGWTLIHEAFFYLLMAVAIAFARERQLPWLLLGWAAATLLAHGMLGAGIAPWAAVASSPLSLEFIALPLLLGGAVLLVAAMLHLAAAYPEHPPVLRRALLFGVPAALLVLGAVRWEHARQPRLPALLLAVGDSSYSLYLGHVFVISATGRLWQASGLNHAPWQHALFIALTVVVCVIAGWLSWRWLELPLHRWTRTRKPSARTLQAARE